jgi:hypothetical protein
MLVLASFNDEIRVNPSLEAKIEPVLAKMILNELKSNLPFL